MAAPDDSETTSEAELITGYRIDSVVALDNAVHGALDVGFDGCITAWQTIVDMKRTELDDEQLRRAACQDGALPPRSFAP